MAILTAGNSITLTLTDSDSVTINTAGVLTLTAVSGLGVAAGKLGEFGGSRTFGPYGAGQLMLAASVADCYYEVADGIPVAVSAVSTGSKYSPVVSQYERALIFAAPPRQGGAVKGFSRNFNDAQYCMVLGAAAANLVSDADIYDCEAGALTVGMSYNAGAPAAYSAKALAFQWRKMLWDLGAGDSLFLQARVKTVGATGNQTLFGNSNGTTEGFGVVLNLAGTIAFNFKAANTAAQSIQIQGVQFDGTNVVSNVVATDTYFNLTIHVDGDTKKLDAWVNGIPAAGNTGGAGNGYGSGGTVLNAGTTIPASPHNFGFGYIPSDDSFTPASVKPTRIQAFRMAVLPAGKKVRSPAFLDWLFNNNPRVLFDDNAYCSE